MPIFTIDKVKQKNDADFKMVDFSDIDVDKASITIASGAITQAASAVWLVVDTQASAASDDLDTITRDTKGPQMLFLSPANGARTIVIKHGTGNILCANNADITLDDLHDFAILIHDGTNWYAQQGVKGDTGATGADGNDGSPGADGNDGADAVVKSTSTSSVAIGTGSKSFTTAAALTLGVGAYMLIAETANPTVNWMFGQISSIAGTSVTINVTLVGGSGTISAWTLTVAGTRGADGATGATGSAGSAGAQGDKGGLRFTFSTTTTMADPGQGIIRFNNATIGSVTAIAIDDLSVEGTDVSNFILSFDDSTSTIKGFLVIKSNVNADATYCIFSVASLTDNAGWTQLAVTHIAGTLPSNAEELVIEFIRNGDKGDTGATGSTGPAPAGQLFLSAAGMWPSTTAGCAANAKTEYATNKINMYSLDFDASTDENCEATVVMPSDWNAGTITAVFYWTAASGSGTVKWYIQGQSYANDDAIDQALGTAVGVEDTLITANDMHISSATSAVTIADATASELVHFKIYRDVSEDTLNADARLLGVMLTFTRT